MKRFEVIKGYINFEAVDKNDNVIQKGGFVIRDKGGNLWGLLDKKINMIIDVFHMKILAEIERDKLEKLLGDEK